MNEKVIRFFFATSLIKDLKDLIKMADSKSQITLSIQTFIISSAMAATVFADIFSLLIFSTPFLQYGFIFFLIVFLFVSITGLMFSIMVFIPRKITGHHHKDVRGLMFYEDINSFSGSDAYIDTLK